MTAINYSRLYAYRFKDVRQDERQRVWTVLAADIYERMNRPEVVLDPASGRCEFLNAVPARERWAVDRLDQGTFREPTIKAVVGDIFTVDLPSRYFGGVFMSNFLEHLPSQDAIAELLHRLRSLMRSDGRIAIMGPNFKFCSREYFDCADHILPLTHVTIQEHLYAAGFSTSTVIPRYVPFSFRTSMPVSAKLTRLYLALPPFWRLLGKQFLVIASPERRSPG